MKAILSLNRKYFVFLSTFLLVLQFFEVTVWSQTPPRILPESKRNPSDQKKFDERKPPLDQNLFVLPGTNIFSPELNIINFDDLPIYTDNSEQISPNRYAGVSFYSPGAATWLTTSRSFSYPDSLIVGNMYPFDEYIYSVSTMIVDFALPAKDVFFSGELIDHITLE
ncbi:MAG: hypothetical protein ACRD6X_13945 [Pyrinomonadaceae bacterium]